MFQEEMKRRQFLKGSAFGVSALAVGLGGGAQAAAVVGGGAQPAGSSEDKIGRPVRVVSIGFKGPRRGSNVSAVPAVSPFSLDWIVDQVDREGARGTDIIALPEMAIGHSQRGPVTQAAPSAETWRRNIETLDGPSIKALSSLAQKHRTYIAAGMSRNEGEQHFNSAVLLDREGKVVCVYNKIFPMQGECMHGTRPGEQVCVHQADFGRVGLAVCFDVNWAALWEQMGYRGAEVVIWPSAYSAGRALQAHAIRNHYYIVSSTHYPDCSVYDIDGQEIVHEENNQGNNSNITRTTLDLDRCIFHQDFNRPAKIAQVLKEAGDDVEENWMPREGWFVLKAKRPGVSARQVAQKYGMEELRPYLNRSQCEVDKFRGWEFS